MKRREFITLLGGAGAAWPLTAHGQQSEKIYRVAYLALVGDRDAMIVKQRLDELGYSEGRNLVFDFRSAQGHPERLPELAAELVATNPDVMVAGFGTATAKAAQGATATIPVVFTSVGDPIGTGIVKSLSRPGANVTGIHAQATDISSKRLQVLTDIAPGIRTVAVLLNQKAPFTAVALPELKIAADARGLRLDSAMRASVDFEEHKTRFRTLQAIARQYRTRPERFGIVRFWRPREVKSDGRRSPELVNAAFCAGGEQAAQ